MLSWLKRKLTNKRKSAFDQALEDSEKEKIPRAPRVQIKGLAHTTFLASLDDQKQPLRLANLSRTGLGFFKDSLEKWPQVGTSFKGELQLTDSNLPLEVEIVRGGPEVVGAKIISAPPHFPQLLKDIFQVELKALELNEVNPSLLKEDPRGQPRWFQAAQNCDLFLIERQANQKLVHFTLNFYGNYFEWNDGGEVTFGVINDEEKQQASLRYSASKLINLDPPASDAIVESAVRFVGHIPSLPEKHQELITEELNTLHSSNHKENRYESSQA